MQMKNISLAIVALAMGAMAVPVIAADNCTSSFYCYGSSAAETVRTATRPPPIAPPSRRYTQQRSQAQLAARNNQRLTPAVTTIAARPATPAPVSRPQTRANTPAPAARPQTRMAPATVVRPQPRPNPVPVARQPVRRPAPAVVVRIAPPPQANPSFRANARPIPPATNRPPAIDRAGCDAAKQTLIKRAAGVESQAVIAATRGERQRSVSLFRDAKRMRTDAQHMNCR